MASWLTAVCAIGLAVATTTGCGRSGDTAVPRRTAYPRVQVCDSVYRIDTVAGHFITVNAEAVTKIVRSVDTGVWIDVEYPRYGSTLHLTLSQGGDVASTMKNRMERMELNVGDSPTTVTELRHAAIEGMVVEAPSARVTPLQLLATDNRTFVLSGALEPSDSVVVMSDVEAAAPIVEALRRDMIKMVEGL